MHLLSFISTILGVCKIDKINGRKIVFVYANDLLGDTFVKIPFFIALRQEFPSEKFHIVMVLAPSNAHMISGLRCADTVIEEPPLHWNHGLFWICSKKKLLAESLRWALRHKAAFVIICHRSRSLGCDFAVRACSPEISVAYKIDLKTPIFPMSAKYQAKKFDKMYSYLLQSKDGRHQIDDMRDLLSLAVGYLVELKAPNAHEVEPIFDFSVADKLPHEYVIIVPGARVEYRRWSTKRFAELATWLNCSIVVVGSESETTLAEEIAETSGLGGRVLNLCGKTTLAQLGGVLIRSRMVITNETGTANYAAVIGAKTVCILGGGDFGAFLPNPYCKNTLCVYSNQGCFNCGWNCPQVDLTTGIVAPCIDAVSVEAVKDAVVRLI